MVIKKYLGQNFLKNKKIAEKIVEAARVNKEDVVLEVGPGKGALTEILVRKAKKVIAVEKDKELADFLMDKFSAKGGSAFGGKGQNNLSIINDDILKFKFENWKLKIGNFKVVANIPYYITSRFLRNFLSAKKQPSLMALMIQKEVAERIVAKSVSRRSKESLLSISVKSYGQPKIVAKVPAKNFSPAPKVDSAIILIDNISKDFFKKNRIDEKKFFEIIRLGFSHKRKLLKNNLSLLNTFLLNTECLIKCGISALVRAEELSLENWRCLYKKLF